MPLGDFLVMTTTSSAAPVAPPHPAHRPEDERPTPGAAVVFGLQHILTMYGGVVAVPLVMGTAAGLDATSTGVLVSCALLVSGLATLLQSLGLPWLGSQLPIVQGISFASVSTMVAVAADAGLPGVFGSIMVAGLLALLVAPVFSHVVRFFPPVVTGSIITVIGLSLLPVAARWAMGNVPTSAAWGSPQNLLLALFTLCVVLACARVRRLSKLSVLIGILAGTVVAAALGRTNFSAVTGSPLLAAPTPFAFGHPTVQVAAVVSMFIALVVIMAETTADILAISEIVETDLPPERLAAGLRADMAATALAPVLNSFPTSAFAQNVGVVAMTGIRSRYVVAMGGAILVLLGLSPMLGAAVSSVPSAVLGGAGVVLFGSVAASGISTLGRVDLKEPTNQLIVASSIAIGIIPVVQDDFYDRMPSLVQHILGSGISAAALCSVLLNLALNELPKLRTHA